MTTIAFRKQENLRLVPLHRSPDDLAQIELVEAINRVRLARQKPRRAAKLAAGELYPVRLIGRLLDDLIAAGGGEADLLQAVMPVIGNLIRRKCRKRRPQHDTGEYAARLGCSSGVRA